MNTVSQKKSDATYNRISLKKLASRNFMLSLLLFVVLVGIMFFASWRDNMNTNQLMAVYDNQSKVGQFKASIADVMIPINDYTMTADTKNFAKIRGSINVFHQRYEDIKSIPNLSPEDLTVLEQVNALMREVLNIANDVAGGKISASQAPQVAVIAQNLVLSSQMKLEAIVNEMDEQLKQKTIQRDKQAKLQLYILLGFIVLIVLLLEVLNRKLVAHAQSVSKVSSDVAESAGDIVEVNKMQSNMTEQQSRFMDKIIKGLELIAISGAKIPLATSKLEKNASVITSFAKGGRVENTETLKTIKRARTHLKDLAESSQPIAAGGNQVLQSLERIRDVSDEANLLALNASIDGGSSITQDVQRMADQIRGYTDDIQTSIHVISSASGEVSEGAEASMAYIDQVATVIEATSDILNRIEGLSDKNGQSAMVVVQALEQQNARNSKILQVLKHISELLHSSDDKLQAYKDASSRLTEASESLQHMT